MLLTGGLAGPPHGSEKQRIALVAAWRRLFGSLKAERLHVQRFVTRRQAKGEFIAWLLWHNEIRMHSTLACVSPVRFEQNWLAAQAKHVKS